MRIFYSLLFLMTITLSNVYSSMLPQGDHEVILIDTNTENQSQVESELENEIKKQTKYHIKCVSDFSFEFQKIGKNASLYLSKCFLTPYMTVFSPPPEF